MPAGTVQALNRTIQEWFNRLEDGSIKLPRFQRHEAWDRRTVVSLLETVFNELPAGAVLVLNVGEKEPFVSRYLVTAPETGARVTEHLLDGQQRLTALWRSLRGTYGDLDLFLKLNADPHEDLPHVEIVAQPRWRKGAEAPRYPRWCDSPQAVYERGLIPLTVVAPGSADAAVTWLQAAIVVDDGTAKSDLVIAWINQLQALRQSIANYNIPYLYLSESTPKDVALDVFVKTNTSNIRLSSFDIVVAQVEAATGSSLHELMEGVSSEVPNANRYGDLGTLALDIACMREGRAATKANYFRLDYKRMADEWPILVESLRTMVQILEGESIFDEARLPSSPVLAVIAALSEHLPTLDQLGNARGLVRYYLWRSFVTRRYESSSGSRAFQDFVGLRDAIKNNIPIELVSAPIFDEREFPLPTADSLLAVRWPKTRDTLARGVLALALAEGSYDIADGAPATRDSVAEREYHHVFPDSTLVSIAGLNPPESYLALNCVLITWRTNRSVSNQSPLQYLGARVANAHLGEAEIKQRLASHLVPWEELSRSGPYKGDTDALRLKDDYNRFLGARAKLVAEAARLSAGAGVVGRLHFKTPEPEEGGPEDQDM